jgi:hypothetical protein
MLSAQLHRGATLLPSNGTAYRIEDHSKLEGEQGPCRTAGVATNRALANKLQNVKDV